MLALLADENFNADVLEGVLRLEPNISVQTARDAGLLRRPDPFVLEWAAEHDRVILTHDKNTLVGHAYARVIDGLPMPGVILVHDWCPLATAVEQVALLAVCLEPHEIVSQVRFLPMRS